MVNLYENRHSFIVPDPKRPNDTLSTAINVQIKKESVKKCKCLIHSLIYFSLSQFTGGHRSPQILVQPPLYVDRQTRGRSRKVKRVAAVIKKQLKPKS